MRLPQDLNAIVRTVEQERQQLAALESDLVGQGLVATQHPDHRIDQKLERLRDRKFTVLVAGEVSAGKSTFINALLGAELLPTGTQQTTSAIVELAYSPDPSLEITFADGSSERLASDRDWERAVALRLRRLAAIPADHERVPIAHIRAALTQSNCELDDWQIRAWHGDKDLNSGNLGLGEFRTAVRAYVQEYGTPNQLPIRIRLHYPFGHRSEVLRILDSPGVNGVGGVESVSFREIRDADAVVFLQDISVAAQSRSFQDFVRQNVGQERSQASLFLVLTKATKLNRLARPKRVEDSRQFFASQGGDPARVFAVDSVLRTVVDDLTEAGCPSRQVLADYVARAEAEWNGRDRHPSHEEQALATSTAEHVQEKADLLDRHTGHFANDAVLVSTLRHESGFEPFEFAIAELAERALHLLADDTRKIIKGRTEALLGELSEALGDLRTKRRDPEQLEREVTDKKAAVDDARRRLNEELPRIKSDYESAEGPVHKAVKGARTAYREKLHGSRQADEIRRHTAELVEDLTKRFGAILQSVQREIDAVVREATTRGHVQWATPTILVDDRKIEALAAASTHEWQEGRTFKETKRLFDADEFRRKLVAHMEDQVRAPLEKVERQGRSVFGDMIEDARKRLDQQLEEKNKAYDALVQLKVSNDDLDQRIKALDQVRGRLAELAGGPVTA